MKTVFLLFIIQFIGTFCMAQEKENIREEALRKSISRQMEVYPASTLKDLYKNFFQDRFGLGHLVTDTTAVRNYLLRELNSYTEVSGEDFEPIGWQHNFYRVNLSVLKKKLIPQDVFFDAFLQSANEVKLVDLQDWKIEWQAIEAVIKSMQLNLPDYETDSKEINERLETGKYVGHHSKQYNEAYHPHYRIISKEIVEEKLFPYVETGR